MIHMPNGSNIHMGPGTVKFFFGHKKSPTIYDSSKSSKYVKICYWITNTKGLNSTMQIKSQ